MEGNDKYKLVCGLYNLNKDASNMLDEAVVKKFFKGARVFITEKEALKLHGIMRAINFSMAAIHGVRLNIETIRHIHKRVVNDENMEAGVLKKAINEISVYVDTTLVSSKTLGDYYFKYTNSKEFAKEFFLLLLKSDVFYSDSDIVAFCVLNAMSVNLGIGMINFDLLKNKFELDEFINGYKGEHSKLYEYKLWQTVANMVPATPIEWVDNLDF